MGYNKYIETGANVKIYKSKQYEADYKKKIVGKHLYKEIDRIQNIEELILDMDNLKELLLNPLSIVYGIDQKKGNLREFFTAKVNGKIRLVMRPVGDYPYDQIKIEEINFIEIDNKHYGEG